MIEVHHIVEHVPVVVLLSKENIVSVEATKTGTVIVMLNGVVYQSTEDFGKVRSLLK